MLTLFFVLLSIGIALFFIPPTRSWLLEELKEVSDRLLLRFLLVTSRFESELTEDGRGEQQIWRAQRLRNLRGLAMRSRQRFEESEP